jgi:hypothetical protein
MWQFSMNLQGADGRNQMWGSLLSYFPLSAHISGHLPSGDFKSS